MCSRRSPIRSTAASPSRLPVHGHARRRQDHGGAHSGEITQLRDSGVSSNPCGECAACREIDEGRFVDLIEVDAARAPRSTTPASCSTTCSTRHPRTLQGVSHRRSAHAVESLLQRAPEDARGAAAAREVPARNDRSSEAAGHRAVALPAVQPEAPFIEPDRRASEVDCIARRNSSTSRRPSRSSRAPPRAACATP